MRMIAAAAKKLEYNEDFILYFLSQEKELLNLTEIHTKTHINYANLIVQIIPRLEELDYIETSKRGKEKLAILTSSGEEYVKSFQQTDRGKRLVKEFEKTLKLYRSAE